MPGLIRSSYTISVNIPRVRVAEEDDILGSAAYLMYKPYLRAKARQLLELDYVEIVATTPTAEGIDPAPLDLCHFDIVVEAANASELRERIEAVRSLFTTVRSLVTKRANPKRPGTQSTGGDSDA